MSELQKRLEHLVNYSSQLIFVSGDSIAQQQRTLEDFLSIQKENTEISYFTSEITMESPDFRRIICRQLLGQKVGSFVRPLKELLKDLHQQPGPFLLCIKQAQTLPNAFLQELWDWVTETKTQSPNHHVNVILFGETVWAEKAKKWLPKRNSNRPVLLSTQSVDSAQFDVNALENLMAEDRPALSLGLFRRNEFSPPVVTQKWFIVGVLILLLSVFVGLMTWQYPEHIKSLLQTGALPPQTDLNVDQLALLNEQLDRQLQSKEDAKDPAQRIFDAELSAAQEKEQTNPLSDVSEDNTDLVTTWDAAKQTSSDKMEYLKETISEQRLAREQKTGATNDAVEPAPILRVIGVDVAEAPSEETDGDFAVPDIISIEQLDATLGKDLLAPSQQEKAEIDSLKRANKVNEESMLSAIEPGTTPTITEPASGRFYEFSEKKLLALPEPSILLQLSGIQNRSVLDEFIADNQLQDLVWVYQTTRYGGAWHVVVFNQRFDSVDEARRAAKLLPPAVNSTESFAKDLRQIKLEIRNR